MSGRAKQQASGKQPDLRWGSDLGHAVGVMKEQKTKRWHHNLKRHFSEGPLKSDFQSGVISDLRLEIPPPASPPPQRYS